MILQLALGLMLSAAIGLAGYRSGALSRSGVLGAILTGTLIFGLGGIVPGLLLVSFFVSSSALSRYRARAKEKLAEKFQKGSRRDLGQALANGGLASLLIALAAFLPSAALFAGFIGALAAVTADTWATEVGVLAGSLPRLVTTGRQVPVGTSGGVTRLGSAAALAGAGFVGAAASILVVIGSLIPAALPPSILAVDWPSRWPALLAAAVVGGGLGALFDSVLGATVQGIYYCDHCGKETERKLHPCGLRTRRVRGFAWMDNDVVNLLASIVGSGAAALVWFLLAR
ncbi:MAG: DUF92 domain-containing protein [Rudaea sp.]